MEEKPVRFRILPVVLAVVVGVGAVIALVLGDFAVQQGLRYLMGKTCSMGALGAYVHGLDAIVFDLPLALATVLLVVLPWRRLPRWAHVALLAGLAAAIIVPLGALGGTFVFRCLNLCSRAASIRRRRTMTTQTQRAWGLIVWAALAFLCAAAGCSGSGSEPAAPATLPPEAALLGNQILATEEAWGAGTGGMLASLAAPQLFLADHPWAEMGNLASSGKFGDSLRAEEETWAAGTSAPTATDPVEPSVDPALAPDGGVPDLLALSALDVRL